MNAHWVKKRKGNGKHPGSLLSSNKLAQRPGAPIIEGNIGQQVVDTQQHQNALGTRERTVVEDSPSELDLNLDPSLNNYCQPSTPVENPPTMPARNGLSGAQLTGSEVYNATPSDRGTRQLVENINGILEAIQRTPMSPMPSSERAAIPGNDYDQPVAYDGI